MNEEDGFRWSGILTIPTETWLIKSALIADGNTAVKL